jgi:spermidine synthase
MPNTKTVVVKESVTTTASVQEYLELDKRHSWLVTANQPIGSDGRLRSAQKTLGHLGVFLNSQTKRVLSIGFGTGETTACLATHHLDRIDCVEIAPALVDLALTHFSHINLGDQLEQKVNMIYMDAKNYLHLTGERYDVIINGANVPYESGSAPMFAKEHFQNASDHLNDGGLFVTKLHLNTAKSVFDSTLGTFLEVFPHVTLWFPVTRPISCFYLVGSQKRQYFSPKYIEEQLGNDAVKDSVSYLHFRDSIDVLSDYIGDENDIGNYLRNYQVNSDYFPFIEFSLDEKKFLHATGFFEDLLIDVRRKSLIPHIDWSGMSIEERSKWLEDYWPSYDALHYLLMAKFKKSPFESLGINNQGLKLMPTHPALLYQQEEYLEMIEQLVRSGWSGGTEFLTALDRELQYSISPDPQKGPPWLIRSWIFAQDGQIDMALHAAERAVFHYPNSKMSQKNLGELYLRKGKAEKAALHIKKALQFDPESPALHFSLGRALAVQGLDRDAVSSYQETIRLNPNFANAQTELDKILKLTHH